MLRWLERLPLLEVIVFEQDSVPRVDSKPASINRRMLFGYNAGPFNKSWGFNVAARQTARPILVFADARQEFVVLAGGMFVIGRDSYFAHRYSPPR